MRAQYRENIVGRTRYKRSLPDTAIAFASQEGRKLFAEAMATDGMAGYFPLAEQFHTQSDPAYCGLGSLVMALNALAIDPERLWKGAWRWFAEDMLDCCLPLAEIRERGLSIDELACLARCNGAEVTVERPEATNLATWRASLRTAAGGDAVIVASYDRAVLGQTGSGALLSNRWLPLGARSGAGSRRRTIQVPTALGLSRTAVAGDAAK